jgi:hypothetical protein
MLFEQNCASAPHFFLFQAKRHFERSIQLLNLGPSQRSNQACQLHFAQTDQVVAQYPAVMFHALVDTHRNLCRESVPATEDRGAKHRGKSGIDQNLAAHHDETAIGFRVVIGTMNAINFASSHLVVLWQIVEQTGHRSQASRPWYPRTSSTSRFSSSAALLISSRLRASTCARARLRKYCARTASMKAERDCFDPAMRSIRRAPLSRV